MGGTRETPRINSNKHGAAPQLADLSIESLNLALSVRETRTEGLPQTGHIGLQLANSA